MGTKEPDRESHTAHETQTERPAQTDPPMTDGHGGLIDDVELVLADPPIIEDEGS